MRKRTFTKALAAALALVMGITVCFPMTGSAATGQKKEQDMDKYLTARVNHEALSRRDSDIPSSVRTQNGFQYSVSKGKATIWGYVGKKKTITIPRTLGKKVVRKIGENAFNNSDIQKVTFAKDSEVTLIGIGAFSWCQGLTSITLPDSVTKIDGAAFCGCINLKKVALGKKVKSIGESAFFYTGLTSFDMPDSVTKLGNEAFLSTFALKKVKLSKKLTEIPDSAFENSGLTSVKLPSSVTALAYKAFYNCTQLNTINLKNIKTVSGMSLKETKWFSKQGDNVYVGTTFVGSNGNPEGILIKKGTTRIADYACEGTKEYWNDNTSALSRIYSRLSTVILPDTVKSIGEAAFFDCPVKKITVPASVTKIEPLALGFTKFWEEDLEHDYSYFLELTKKEFNIAPGEDYGYEVGEEAWHAYSQYLAEEKARLGVIDYDQPLFGDPAAVIRTQKTHGSCIRTEDFELHGKAGSAAEEYAVQHGMKFVAE